MKHSNTQKIPAAWSSGAPRPGLTTEEVGAILRVRPQTIRASLCRRGHYLGLHPIKLGNRLLRWDARAVERLLDGGAA